MTSSMEEKKVTKADAAFFRRLERMLDDDIRSLARAGDWDGVQKALTAHAWFLERHPEYMPGR